MRSDERSLRSMVLKEIENQIEDKVVPVISSIMGSGRARERDSRLESYEDGDGESTPHFQDNRNSTNERSPVMRVPFVQEENGFI